MDNEYLLNFRIPLCLRNNQEVKLNLAKPEDELVKKSFLYLDGIFIGILTGIVTLAFFSYLIFNFVS